jgi:hypothetical protein
MESVGSVGFGAPEAASVLLYWLPLGAGGRSVRFNGRVYEACAARMGHRPVQDLYHSALEVRVDGERFTIEMTPAWGATVAERGVVREGPVGAPWLARFQAFRYEIRRWRSGVIPDLAEAVGGPQVVGLDAVRARQLLELVPTVPAFTWGRDEANAGDMWNSNSVIAWLLVRSGHDISRAGPPLGGRAPGWRAGLAVGAIGEPDRVQLR